MSESIYDTVIRDLGCPCFLEKGHFEKFGKLLHRGCVKVSSRDVALRVVEACIQRILVGYPRHLCLLNNS